MNYNKPITLLIVGIVLLGSTLFSGCNDDDGPVKNPNFYELDISTTKNLQDISFIDDDNGIACGGFGFFSKTTDGGKTWHQLDVGVNHSFLSCYMLDLQTYFTARLGLYVSSNEGDTFNELADHSSIASSIFDIHFFDQMTGVIIKSGQIYRTEDGGNTWTDVYRGGTSSFFSFPSNTTGFLAGGATFDGNSSGAIHKTTDAGRTWVQVLSSPLEVRAIHFLNNTLGYYTTEQELYKSIDGGMSWEKISDIDLRATRGVLFLDEGEGYIIGFDGEILKTLDGGLAWELIHTVIPNLPLNKIIKTPNHLYVVGSDGILLKKDL